MFVDTSAIVEILLSHPRSRDLILRLEGSTGPRSTGPTVVYEATVVVAGKQMLSLDEAERLVRSLLKMLNITVMGATDETASAAIDAFARFGKGRHPARLNFGDCFAYAGAKASGLPLLYVGDDFAQTDLA
jgi:ribonuclease VapC